MSDVTYAGDDGPPVLGVPVEDTAAQIAELRATVDGLLALIAGEG